MSSPYAQQIAFVILVTVNFIFPVPAVSDCIYCPSNNRVYRVSDVARCIEACGESCIQVVIRGGEEPTNSQNSFQSYAFPHLANSCYAVTDQDCTWPFDCPANHYNCAAFALGWTDGLVNDEIDANGDGELTVSEFDSFVNSQGYTTSANCDIEEGKEKLALFGPVNRFDPSGTFHEFHIARQAAGMSQTGGPWFESKEGGGKRIIHRLNDLEGYYGTLTKCYERAACGSGGTCPQCQWCGRYGVCTNVDPRDNIPKKQCGSGCCREGYVCCADQNFCCDPGSRCNPSGGCIRR